MYNYLKKINFMKLTNKLVFLGIFGLILIAKDLQSFNYSNIKINPQANDTGIIKIFLDEMENSFESITQDDLLANVDDFIDLPKGGTSWSVFGETGMNEYTFQDDEGYDWLGFRPEFKKKITNLNGKEILIQGYMFPLEQGEKQSLFLLGPFPITCPYHPHVSSNLTIEVYAKKPITYTYEAVNIKGTLELVSNDNLYNIFYRLKNSKIVK